MGLIWCIVWNMRGIKMQDRNWFTIQSYYDQGHNTRKVEKEFKISCSTLFQAKRLGLFKTRTHKEGCVIAQSKPRKPLSEESRQKMSEARKRWNRENPEKVRAIFSRLSKTKSIPCEHLKNWLKQREISFVEEYQPLFEENRFYSIDIAFPDKKIGVEVNGDMHYGRDGNLREYYQIRHDTIESRGWKLYEIPRKIVFNEEKMSILFKDILSSQTKQEFDFLAYVPPIKKKDLPKIPKVRKPPVSRFSWPTKEILTALVYQKTLTAIAKEQGACANSLKKHCRKENILYPPKGYWRRRECGFSHEESLLSQKRVVKPRHRMKLQEIEQAMKLRQERWSYGRIGKHLGFSHTCVSDTLQKQKAVSIPI